MASNLERLLKTQQVIKVSQFYSYKFNISKMSKMTVKTTNNELGQPVDYGTMYSSSTTKMAFV